MLNAAAAPQTAKSTAFGMIHAFDTFWIAQVVIVTATGIAWFVL